MTPNMFHILVGQRVQKAEMIHDYLQLSFDKGWVLNIFNGFTVFDFDSGSVASLVGSLVKSIGASDEAVDIFFRDGKSVRVGVADSDYRGPEAMELIGVTGERIVWS